MIFTLEIFFLSLLGLATIGIGIAALTVLIRLFRGQR